MGARKSRFLLSVSKAPRHLLNWFFDLWVGGPRRPVFFKTSEIRPELQILDDNWDVIRLELSRILPHAADLPQYHDLDKLQYTISGRLQPEKSWRVYLLNAMGEVPKKHREACPETIQLVAKIPGLFQAFFSILEAGKSVPAHEGPMRGYLRYHLGLVVPEEDPPSLRVKDQIYHWKDGESVIFDDSWEHEVFNDCPHDRVVLIVDFLRPLPLLPGIVNRVLAGFIRHFYGKPLARRVDRMDASSSRAKDDFQAPTPSSEQAHS